MKLCDEKIQNNLFSGGKIKRRIETREIIIHLAKTGTFFDNNDNIFFISIDDLTADDWEIVEPEYDWDKIIKDKVLCVFSDNKNFKDEIISILTKVDDEYYYTTNGIWFKYCKLFNPEKFNITKDLKEYEL